MASVSHSERLLALEVELKSLRLEVSEIHDDVKLLLAAYNRQSGAAKLKSAIWTGIVGLAAAAGGIFAGRGH